MSSGAVFPREVVVDASLALNLAFGGHPYHAQARRFYADFTSAGTRLIAPPLFEAEADSVVRRAVHGGWISAVDGQAAFLVLDALPVAIIHDAALRAQARQIADRFDRPRVYDATYAALADLRGCELWTADERFYNAVQGGLRFVRFVGAY